MCSPSFRSLLAYGCVLLLLLGAAIAGDVPNPLILRIDLRSMGATGLQAPSDEPDRPVYSGHLSFIDNSTLAISFPVFNPVLKLSTRAHPTGGSILLHTVVLDVENGHIKAQKSWGNAGKTEMIAAGSRFVVIGGRDVQVISADLNPEREYRYSFNVPFRLRTSETGNTLFLIAQEEHEELVEVLDTAGRESPYTFRMPSEGKESFSDVNLAFTRPQGKNAEIIRIPLEQLRQGKAHQQPLPFRAEGPCRDPFFITDDLLVLGGACDQLTVLSADGSIKAQQRMPVVGFRGPAGSLEISQTSYLAGFVASRDKKRFAVIHRDLFTQKRKGEIPAQAFHARTLAIYDTTLATISEIPVPQVERATYAMDQAISPDGSLVALLVGWNVYVYRVPEQAP